MHSGACVHRRLYIVVDDLRNELAYTNGRKGLVTPHIDALAAKGMVFDRAYIQQGVCSPSRNSFLSGRRPDTTQIWNFKNSFRTTLGDCVSSWPGAFKNAGYIATGMGKVYHPGHPKQDDGNLSWSLDWAPYYHPSGFAKQISNASDSTFQDGMITDVALQRLQALGRQRRSRSSSSSNGADPFFMAVGLHKPHIPWVMPQRFLDQQLPLEQMDIAKRDVPPENYCNASLYICDNVYNGLPWEPANASAQQDHRRKYRAAVSWTDFNVGRVLATVEEEGFSNDTAVIFNGDHGWHLGEQGGWCKQSNFDLVARVPLIVYIPWLPQSHGQRTSAMVEIVDLMPTALELMGIRAATPDYDQLEGTSFLPLLLRPTLAPSLWKNATFTPYPRCNSKRFPSLAPWVYPSDNACTGDESSTFAAMGYSIRTDRWRYTLWLRWDGAKLDKVSWDAVTGEELYDHLNDDGRDTDKFDNVNLGCASAQYAPVCAAHKAAMIAGWRQAKPNHEGH
jgi:iduronate 2-sulfatase